jgi:hypothetical protein
VQHAGGSADCHRRSTQYRSDCDHRRRGAYYRGYHGCNNCRDERGDHWRNNGCYQRRNNGCYQRRDDGRDWRRYKRRYHVCHHFGHGRCDRWDWGRSQRSGQHDTPGGRLRQDRPTAA